MEPLGQTLEHYLNKRRKAFTFKTVCQIGINMVHLFEHLHNIGYIYNDLKLENILVGDKDSSPESLAKITLIDFGLCSRFLTEDG